MAKQHCAHYKVREGEGYPVKETTMVAAHSYSGIRLIAVLTEIPTALIAWDRMRQDTNLDERRKDQAGICMIGMIRVQDVSPKRVPRYPDPSLRQRA